MSEKAPRRRVLTVKCPRCYRVRHALDVDETPADWIGELVKLLPIGCSLQLNSIPSVPKPCCKCQVA